MKKSILIILGLFSFAGCGLVEDMGRQCGGSLEQVCHMIFGYNSSDIKQNERDIEELKKRLIALETQMNGAIGLINVLQIDAANGAAVSANLQTQIDALLVQIEAGEGDVAALQNQVATLELEVDSINNRLDIVEGQIVTLQNTAVQSQVDIIQLQSEDRVVEYVDPCGNGPGFDEVILRTSSNKLVVYFEDGSRRFLTTLIPGLYQTTDQQACQFSVQSDMSIINLGSAVGPVLVYSEAFSGTQSGISLTCIANNTTALNRSQVRIRSEVNQNVTVELVGGVSAVVAVKAGENTFVTFSSKGTVRAIPTLSGTTQVNACN